MKHVWLASLTAGPLLLAASTASAAPTACGWVGASWNAPNGAAVFSDGPGPVQAVLHSLGEFRSHSMLSHGPGGLVSHATMKSPGQNGWPDVCRSPISTADLLAGQPGLSQVNQAGIWEFLYGDTSGSGPTFLAYQLGDPNRAAAIANAIYYMPTFLDDRSTVDHNVHIDHPARGGARVPYSFYQYREIEQTNLGIDSSAAAWNNGMACSGFLSFAHAYAGQGVIPAFTYSHAKLRAATDAVVSSVQASCESQLGFWDKAALGVVCPFYGVCGNAGNQIANCMATHRCETGDPGIWQGVYNDPASTATSISPDRIGGWAGFPWGSDPGATVWSIDDNNPVYFNVPGAVYGCWE